MQKFSIALEEGEVCLVHLGYTLFLFILLIYWCPVWPRNRATSSQIVSLLQQGDRISYASDCDKRVLKKLHMHHCLS